MFRAQVCIWLHLKNSSYVRAQLRCWCVYSGSSAVSPVTSESMQTILSRKHLAALLSLTQSSDQRVINCQTSSNCVACCTASLSQSVSWVQMPDIGMLVIRCTDATRHRQVDKWDAEVPLTAEWSGPVWLGRAGGSVPYCNRDSDGGNASCRVCYCLNWFAGVSHEPQCRQRPVEAWTGCIRHVNATSRHHTADRVRST